MVYPSLQGPSSVCDEEERTRQRSEDVYQEMVMGPVEVMVSVGLLMVSP